MPDAVVTVADRFETMATAIAASYMNIPLIHIQGGEVTGNIDEKVRHAITKLADLHFVASEKAKERVIKMGEDPQKVFLTGCPSIDIAGEILNDNKYEFDPYTKYIGSGKNVNLSDGYVVVLQHPVTTEYSQSRQNIEETLDAMSQLDMPILWFWPNVDAGADGTSKGIRVFRELKDTTNFHFFKNMEPDDFLRLIKNSHCLIGNSSVGIRECAYLGIPVVNIGGRQAGRERSSNVIDVPYDKDKILNAVKFQIKNGHYSSNNIYGDGRAGEKIADIIASVPFSIEKILMY
jgi:UDP-hydrolysing UDP-N-acetyl-D-glucosamine 2-epimerase